MVKARVCICVYLFYYFSGTEGELPEDILGFLCINFDT